MHKTLLQFLFSVLIALTGSVAFAAGPVSAKPVKIMVLDFQLNDLTDLPNAPEELARVDYLSTTFKQKLVAHGVELIPVNERLKNEIATHSATYLFERVNHAAELAQGSGADYLIIGVAMKPTALFVYPRLRMVDIRTRQGVLSAYAQLESSWSDQNTTANTAAHLANNVGVRLKELSTPSQ